MDTNEKRAKIQELKDLTGADAMDCLKSLVENNWDIELAKNFTKELCPYCGEHLRRILMQIIGREQYYCESCGDVYHNIEGWNHGI
jgi:predicted RNA-binding Zn-ribbon protein involved in translation (DUF1610 family)